MELVSSKWADISLESVDGKKILTSRFLLISHSEVFKIALEKDLECKTLALGYSAEAIHLCIFFLEREENSRKRKRKDSADSLKEVSISTLNECLLLSCAYQISEIADSLKQALIQSV